GGVLECYGPGAEGGIVASYENAGVERETARECVSTVERESACAGLGQHPRAAAFADPAGERGDPGVANVQRGAVEKRTRTGEGKIKAGAKRDVALDQEAVGERPRRAVGAKCPDDEIECTRAQRGIRAERQCAAV